MKLGHVALDGTRIKANASKHKAMSYGRMVQAEAALAAEVAGWLAAAEAADDADDAELGPDRRGDELPAWVADKAARLAKIREAKAALEAAARGEAEAAGKPAAAEPAAQPRRGRPPKTPPGTPEDKAQRNFTDPDSRIMTTKDGFIQGYNAQAAVDGADQIIVAHGGTNDGSDQAQLTPLLDAIQTHVGREPEEVSADAGYCSEANLEALEARSVRGYVATGRQRHGQAAATGRGRQQGPRVQTMRQRLRRGGFRSRYRLRKQTVEPVFGQIKQAPGFRQFLTRWPCGGPARMGAGLHRPQPGQADPGPGLRPAPGPAIAPPTPATPRRSSCPRHSPAVPHPSPAPPDGPLGAGFAVRCVCQFRHDGYAQGRLVSTASNARGFAITDRASNKRPVAAHRLADQAHKFVETARELGCDEDPEAFKRALELSVANGRRS